MKIKQWFAAVGLATVAFAAPASAAITVNDLGHVVASPPPSTDGTGGSGTSEALQVGRPVVLAASNGEILIGSTATNGDIQVGG